MAFQFNNDEETKYKKMISKCIKENIIPNIFARYALIKNIENPFSLPLDNVTDEDINQSLVKIKNHWDKNINNPKFTIIYKKLKNPKEIEVAVKNLLDHDLSKNEKKKIENECKDQILKKYEKINQILDIFVSVKTYITSEEIKTIYNNFSSDFSEHDIINYINEKKIQIKDSEDEKLEDFSDQYPVLEDTILRDFRVYLNVLNFKNVYEFLGVSENDSINQIRKSYGDLEIEWGKSPNDNKKEAAQRILGIIKTNIIYGDFQKYSNSMNYQIMKDLDYIINAAFSDGILEDHELSKLISKAKDEGCSNSEYVKQYILNRAKNEKIHISKQKDPNAIKCPNCFSFNDKSINNCRNCGKPLYIDCFKCKKQNLSSNKACDICGFIFNNIEKVHYLKEKKRIHYNQGNLKETLNSLCELQKLLGRDNDEINIDISDIENEIKNTDTIYLNYETFLSNNELYKSQDELRKLKKQYPTYQKHGKMLDEIILDINKKIKIVESHLQKAKELEHNKKNDEAVNAYEYVLKLCKDCEEAKNGLIRIPPEPPGNMAISYNSCIASINWQKSPSIGELNYLLIRKERSKPTSVNDGTLIIKTRNLIADDNTGEIGHNYYYSLFTERKGTFSLTGATTDCVLFYADVTNFTLSPMDGVIEGNWKILGKVNKVLVYRKEGSALTKVGDGEEISVLGLTKFIDKNVHNNQKYFYKIFCEFVDHKNSTVLTEGVEASAVPNAPPPALDDFTIKREESKIHVNWTPLEKGTLYIIKSPNAPAYKNGEVISKSKIGKLGTLLASGNNYATDSEPQHGIYFYTAITIENDLAVIGKTHKLNFVEDVSTVRGNYFGSHIQLKWKWPAGCKEVLVSWRHDVYPTSAEDINANQKKIPVHTYELEGGFNLKEPERKKYLFRIFAMYKDDNEDLFSSGIGSETGTEINVQEGKIKYTIKKSLFSSKYKFFIQSDIFIKDLPEIILVANRNKICPINKQSGVELIKIKNTSIGPEEKCIAELEKATLPKPCYLKIFFTNELSYTNYRIVHPNPREAIIK